MNCSSEGLYYSRRIGRTPELAAAYGDTVPLEPTTIVGAAKLLGRFPSGMTIGVLDATTQRAASPGDTTYEPLTNFTVARVTQDLRHGSSTIGAMLTAVNRNTDHWSAPYLPENAYAAGVDFQHRFLHHNYQIAGSFDQSRVQGSPAAMLGMQTDAVHYYQRPDAALPLDSGRTVLGGNAEEFKFAKVGGSHLMFESAYQRRSPGFEINDVGYLRRADQQSWSTWVGWFDRHQRAFYNRFQWNNNWWQYWTHRGAAAGGRVQHQHPRHVPEQLVVAHGGHGGPARHDVRRPRRARRPRDPAGSVRQPVAVDRAATTGARRCRLWTSTTSAATRGAIRRGALGREVDYKLMGRFSAAFHVNWQRNVSDNQWFGNSADSAGTHYTFAHLDQTTTSATVRLNYTFTPAVSLQAYVQPFVSKGEYSNVRQLSATPRASRYADRYAPFDDPAVTGDPGGFNFKEFQSNLVFRWEYRPGSTLFVIWNEGRQGYAPAPGNADFTGDVRGLFGLHPENTFLVKVSYWVNR